MATAGELYVVRHGQSANRGGNRVGAGSPDPGLSVKGVEQAAGMAASLSAALKAADGPVKVVCSPMKRCLLTARPLLDAMDLHAAHVTVHGGLYEYKACSGEYEGTTSEEIIAATAVAHTPVHFAAGTGRWLYCGKGGAKETDPQVIVRISGVAAWLRGVLASAAPARVVVVAHQTVGDLLLHILVAGTPARWEYGAPRFKMGNAGVLRFSYSSDGAVRPAA
eukprot:TRINITY_DN30614_c0_g1_i1.p2 TRINITY_DN30614_c0_g1~~TRINITY_DN30614_c0_g1_i1.p2  ORF type:complete len:222 (+),score=67.45 TRINITY_DN30614_c0_g1_i1:100-765(+)